MYHLNSPWVPLLQSAKKTTLSQSGRRKVHYTMPDGAELAEEYDEKTNLLLVRKWRVKNKLGGVGKWETEVGEPEQNFSSLTLGNDQILENFSNPLCYRQDTSTHFQWRIRNLPYPIANYKLTVENETIIVRTVNKKYYKVIKITDLSRSKIPLVQSKLTFAHSSNTLIIKYEKPAEIIKQQNVILNELKKIKTTKEGDMDCKQQ